MARAKAEAGCRTFLNGGGSVWPDDSRQTNPHTTHCATLYISCGFLQCFALPETLTGIHNPAPLLVHTGLPSDVRIDVLTLYAHLMRPPEELI